ncbi:MAG: hypothetical protein V1872_07135 [bacterium]
MNSDTKKILVIRSASRIFEKTLKALKDEFPNSKIDVLVPESAENSIRENPFIHKIILLKTKGRLRVLNLGIKGIKEIRLKKYDLSVVLYNIDHGMGYSNVDVIAATIGAKECRGYNVTGKFELLTKGNVIKKFLKEKSKFLLIIINFFFVGVLFFVVTLSLILECVIRNLKVIKRT